MAELLIRASLQDRARLRRLFGGDPQGGRATVRPDRVVVDAHVPVRTPQISELARAAGVGYIIDPQTHFFQDVQPASDRWAGLPFGLPHALTPEEASRPAFLVDLTRRVVDYQMRHGATAVIPPYVYVDRPDSEWIDVQAAMWDYARDYLANEAIALPVIAVMALGWRMLHPVRGIEALEPVLRSLVDLAPREVALAASKVDDGAHPDERAMDLVLAVERLARDHSVLLWQQGRLGELGVAAGAIGYETGVGWRERCNLPATLAVRRRAPSGGGFSARPVYLAPLGFSISRRSLQEIRQHRDVWAHLICTDADCCPTGGPSLLENDHTHAIVQRIRRLRELDAIDRPVWRWQTLVDASDGGLELAARINRLASAGAVTDRVDTHSLFAINSVSHLRRLDSRSSGVA